MDQRVAIGIQNFEELRQGRYFYIDKTNFIKKWWEKGDSVTLITRPRRFGKTITMSMLECFFSVKYADRKELFEDLEIWKDEQYRILQGTYPVVFLSFAGVKQNSFEETKTAVNQLIVDLYDSYRGLLDSELFDETDKKEFAKITTEMDDPTAAYSIRRLCKWLERYYGKKCIVLLDEYDTPMQEAYINGYWDELTGYFRALFNNTFKTNPHMTRGIMTGITRISKESIFSDLNNLNVITTTSEEYAANFGFTEDEVFAAMDERGLPAEAKAEVKRWYDGFTFGKVTDIYNPWSILNYLDKGCFDAYWVNTSGNGLVAHLLQKGSSAVKIQFEALMRGENIQVELDEQILYDQLDQSKDAIWSLLLASGYLKVVQKLSYEEVPDHDWPVYTLAITNYEVNRMFRRMVMGWFHQDESFGSFVQAMLQGDEDAMTHYMNRIALTTFSYFDAGTQASDDAPERFYHGFVLGLMVEKAKDYTVTSNRESGFGRYDVILCPKVITAQSPAVIIEFKVMNDRRGEKTLEDTAKAALQQIEEKSYAADLLQRGIPESNIFKYGFAFKGKECLIRKA